MGFSAVNGFSVKVSYGLLRSSRQTHTVLQAFPYKRETKRLGLMYKQQKAASVGRLSLLITVGRLSLLNY